MNDLRNEIRKQVIALRSELPRPYRLHKSAAICDALTESFAFTQAALNVDAQDCIVAVYSAFDEEVQLDDFICAAYDSGARVAFPCLVTDAQGIEGAGPQTMEMRIVDQDSYLNGSCPFLASPLAKYTHDDDALTAYPYVPGDELTMIVVPLVAFDLQKNRLGYGGGNYDRYLPQLSDDCRAIAVAFAEQEVPSIPIEEHDIPVNVLVR